MPSSARSRPASSKLDDRQNREEPRHRRGSFALSERSARGIRPSGLSLLQVTRVYGLKASASPHCVKGSRMAEVSSAPPAVGHHGAVPATLINISFVLAIVTLAYFPTAYLTHVWIFGADGRGIPTDFVNVWAAGKLALEDHPAQAWD